MHKRTLASCRCGDVRFEVTGVPIISCLCYCASCQEAGSRFEQRPNAPAALDPDGGTGLLLYRKDRIRCVTGTERLQEYRLTPTSSTRRVLAGCCNSAMFLEIHKGHWLSMYRNRFSDGVPPVELRTMTKYRRAGVEFTDDIPSYSTYSFILMRKLLVAWVAMGFRSPTISYGKAAA